MFHIKNGYLIDPKNKRDGLFDLVIQNGKVLDILKPGQKVADSRTIDAGGMVVSPGFIDLHVHLREPGQEYKETIETGTRAAAAGGFTSVCVMANTEPVNDSASVTHYILKQAREKGAVNVFPVGALTKGLEGKELAPMGELIKAGCVAFSDDGKYVQDAQVMRLAMEYAKSFQALVISHALDLPLCCGGVMNEGQTSTRLGLRGIPNEAEDIAVAREIYLSQLTGTSTHIAHISTGEAVKRVAEAKKRNLPVTCEVTPHHLFLNDERVGSYDTHAKMAPPLRSQNDCDQLIEALASGVIDAVATDHAPHAPLDKEIEFDQAAFGVVGLETAFALMMQLVHQKKIPLKRLIELFTVNPAKIVGIKKGSLEKGADADITIFDPDAAWKIDPANFLSKSKNTPFGGMKVKGKVKYTIVSGRIVYS